MFLSRIKAEDRSPWGNFWFEPVGVRTMSGLRVSADTAMTLSAVFRAVGLVSGHMGLLPLKFYERGTFKPVKHPLIRILNIKPNRYQNAFELREMLQGHLELRGNCYCEIFADRKGEIQELMPRHPDRVRVEMTPDGDYRYVITDLDGTTRIVQRGGIWHIRGLSSNGITGISVIECARESFGLGLAAQSYGARFFANDAKPAGGWIEFPGAYKDKMQKNQIRESMQEAQSGANRGKLMLLDHGMKYHEVGLNNTDAQFLETRQFQIGDVARWFGVPPHKIGDLAQSTNNNIEQQALEYMQDGLLTRASRWELSIISELLFDDEEIDVKYDFSALLRGDSTMRSNFNNKAIMGGWMTRNEARASEGMEPLPGLDEPLRPLNMVEERDAERLEKDNEATEMPLQPQELIDPADPNDQKPTKESATRLNALLQGNAERLARRFAKSGITMDDVLLVTHAMVVSEADAKNFCSLLVGTNLTDENALAAMLMRLANATK